MDGFWVISMSFTLPLAKAARKLPQTRPTSSVLGPHTLSSILGILFLNFIFTVIALLVLFHQDFFQCRRWDNDDVSNLLVIGDNYEAQTLFLLTGYQYISSAMAFSFGYEFRQAWYRNTLFVTFVTGFTIIHMWIILVPGKLSCLWRVNCDNEHALYSLSLGRVMPIQNPFHTTLMPWNFRFILLFLIVANTAANIAWEYCVVNRLRKKYAQRKRERAPTMMVPPKDVAETFETV
jgi:magnesium-transporting ATPase (P-type)